MSRASEKGGRTVAMENVEPERETEERVLPASVEEEATVEEACVQGGASSPEEGAAGPDGEEDARPAACGAACAAEEEADAGEAPSSSVSVPENAVRDAGAPVPGELDMLRVELLSEELEQNAVEQMFRRERRDRCGEEPSEEGAEDGLSGQALLEAVHHGRYVAALAVDLFEALADTLSLDERWARILVQAALWHDLGFAVSGRRRHHKIGMEIVEQTPELSLSFGLEEADRPLVALLVRYHRRAWPSMKHRRFAALCRGDRRALAGAAALLRMADGLDYRHKGAVEEIRVRLRRRTVSIVCFGSGSCRKECRRALKKGDLFERLCGRTLEISQGKEGDRHAC